MCLAEVGVAVCCSDDVSLDSRESAGLQGRRGSLPPRHPGLAQAGSGAGLPLSPTRRHSSPRSSRGAHWSCSAMACLVPHSIPYCSLPPGW